MDRVKRQTAVTISNAWYVGGVIADPGAVTIGITRDDGTVLVPAGTATVGAGAAQRTFALTTAHTSVLDLLTATWTTSLLGVDTSMVEIVGDFLFSIAQARALDPLGDTARYTTQMITDARTLAETALEDACGVAFVPRYRRESFSGIGMTQTMLGMPRVTAIRSLQLDGSDVTDLSTVVPIGSGTIYYPAGFTRGFGNYAIAYEHGWASPPPRVSNAALLLARRYLVDSPVSDRATSMTTDDGTTQFLVTAGVRQAVFDIPEANAVVAQYGLNAYVA
jgi:hypothetical protein